MNKVSPKCVDLWAQCPYQQTAVGFLKLNFTTGNVFQHFLPYSECFLRTATLLYYRFWETQFPWLVCEKRGEVANNTPGYAYCCHLCVGKRKTAIAPHHPLALSYCTLKHTEVNQTWLLSTTAADSPVSHGASTSFYVRQVFESFCV